ncbi:MAG: transporter [Betaproteobacteria bacterium]
MAYRARTRVALAALSALMAAPAVQAAHPLLTEDTGTQGIGNAELEKSLSWTRDGADRLFVFQPQLSYGLRPTLDVIVAPSWLAHDPAEGGNSRGFGDTVLDLKWRFHASEPLSLALRAGATLPTGEPGLSAGKASTHALLATTIDGAALTLHGNLGYVRNAAVPGVRTSLYHVSAAAVVPASARLSFAADVAFDSNPDPALRSWPGVALIGIICSVRRGLDLDLGVQTRLNRAAPTRQWLAGVTYRWVP